ncbi:MAG: hypothetical protein H7Y05_11825 [Steroidobacteraceae bacterium]|nr:hypothetical protein [Deltaproteobacteria bacterium]
MRVRSFICLAFFLAAAVLSGCGDGGGGGSSATPAPTATSGLLKLSTSGNANTIGAIEVTVDLPAGVVVQADSTTGEAAAGVVTISGVAAVGVDKLVSAKYTPGTPGRLNMILINTTGFGLGEFATIKFDMAAGGSFPASKDAFAVTAFAAKDLSSNALVGVTAAPASLSAGP